MVYSELIRSDIPGPFGVNPPRPLALRPSLPSIMKPSREGPFAVKPNQEELQVLVESLAKKKRSVKRKAQAPSRAASRFGVRSRGWEHLLRRRFPKSGVRLIKSRREVRRLLPWPRCLRWRVRKILRGGGGTVEPPLEVLPIYVWSPSAQNAKLPPTTPEVGGKDCFGTEGDEDSLLTNSELAAGAIASILRNSDLKRVDAMSAEEALDLSLQGVAIICPDALICSFHRCFKLFLNFVSFLQIVNYMKTLARRASFAEGSARASKTYKAKVASLTSEKADL